MKKRLSKEEAELIYLSIPQPKNKIIIKGIKVIEFCKEYEKE